VVASQSEAKTESKDPYLLHAAEIGGSLIKTLHQ
jgi:hypothetical protein